MKVKQIKNKGVRYTAAHGGSRVKKSVLVHTCIPAFVAVIALFCAVPVSAGYFSFEPEDTDTRTPQDYYDDFSQALPEDLRMALAGGEDAPQSVPWQAVLSETLTSVADELFPAFERFGALAAVCVLCSILCEISRAATPSALTRAAPLLARCAIVSAALAWQISGIGVMRGAIRRLVSVASGLVPALSTLCAASGSVTTASLGAAGFAMLCTLAADGFALVCMPMLCASLALGTIAGTLGAKIAGAVSKFLRTALGAICTAGMTMFVFFFNLQMNLAKSADSALYRAVRLALSSFVPVVGGQVADASGQLGASFALIRSGCGAIAVCAVLVLTLPMIVRLVADRAVLFVCRHIVGTLSPESGEEALEELGSVCTMQIAAAVEISVAFVMCLAAFVGAAGAAG